MSLANGINMYHPSSSGSAVECVKVPPIRFAISMCIFV